MGQQSSPKFIPAAGASVLQALSARARGALASRRERPDPETGLAAAASFQRSAEAALRRCAAHRLRCSVAVFDTSNALGECIDDPGVVARYRERLVERLKLLAAGPGVLARTGSSQFAVLLPMVGERLARRMILQELGAGFDVPSSSQPGAIVAMLLPPPSCGVVEIPKGERELGRWLREATLEAQDMARWETRAVLDRQASDTLSGQAASSGLVAQEVDASEWFRAIEHPTTIRAPLKPA